MWGSVPSSVGRFVKGPETGPVVLESEGNRGDRLALPRWIPVEVKRRNNRFAVAKPTLRVSGSETRGARANVIDQWLTHVPVVVCHLHSAGVVGTSGAAREGQSPDVRFLHTPGRPCSNARQRNATFAETHGAGYASGPSTGLGEGATRSTTASGWLVRRQWTVTVYCAPARSAAAEASGRTEKCMRSIRSILASILVLAVVVALAPIGSAQAVFEHLRPDHRAWLPETVPVNFVFVGYTRDEVNRKAFLAGLPDAYRPLVRSRLFYGIREPLGLRYTFEHRVTFTSPGFEDAFFGELAALSQPADRTEFQRLYNQQEGNVRTVRHNHFIDAASVEQWLIEHPPSGVDTTRDTVFFINWWGRPDFEYHVYTKTDEPDPDTGYNFGVARESRKIIAWGGTPADDEESGLGARGTHRVWFYDLSAGPESWTDNWNVDDPDLDGDGRPEYRMPPIWEYLSRGGVRNASALSGDLSKVARFVAIDLLFTTSPLYPPALTPPRLPATVNLDLNTYEAWPGVDVSERFIEPGLVRAELSDLPRHVARSAGSGA